jgi:demethylmenaquinone methyltransferase/2-methoxy-6-polyprenyl-1,4-benzoquinol methylase
MFDHFGILAPFYERVIRPKIPEKLIGLLRLPVDGRLLDAGGGTGRISQALRDLSEHVVIADASAKMLQQAQVKGGLITVHSLSEALPFSQHTFDRVIMVDALHHVINQDKTIKELWRVVKPGGIVVIEEPDIRTTVIKVVALAEKIALMRSRFLSPLEIAALFPQDTRPQIHVEGYNAWVVIEKGAAAVD